MTTRLPLWRQLFSEQPRTLLANDDFTVTATLTNTTVGASAPPVYRVELVGTLSGLEAVFAERDVLIAAGSDVSVSFTGLPKALFSAQNLKVRAWYAASGLGPVYTYGEDASVGGQVTSVTYADPYDDEPQADKTQTVYSTVLANSGAFSDCIRTRDLSVTALPQPQLDPTAAIEFTTDVDNSRIMYYTFKWDTSTTNRTDMHYHPDRRVLHDGYRALAAYSGGQLAVRQRRA